MKVINRKGESVDIQYNAVKERIMALCTAEELDQLDLDDVVIHTIQGIHDGITTSELDELSARVCAGMQSSHFLYGEVAGRILMSNIQKNIKRRFGWKKFSEKMLLLWEDDRMNDAFAKFIRDNADALDAIVSYERDMTFGYFAVKTLERSYLLRHGEDVIETPQDMFMRVAVSIHLSFENVDKALERVRETYELMSEGLFTHATPTLFNAGTKHEQMSSCYLLGVDDSLSGIYKLLGDCAQISKWAGGIGIHVSNVRSRGSKIASTNGTSDGIIPMLKVFNETARYCNQAGRRKGSIAVYLEPWHADVWDFCELKKNTGAETERARDLFLALWVPDLFMRCVENDEDWYLMSPDVCPGLNELHGYQFEEVYQEFVKQGKYVRKLKARELWYHIMSSQIETGVPYIGFKDAVNAKTNQQNIGVIKSSNLCIEICQVSDTTQYATCNLASIAVNRFVDKDNQIDHERLHAVAKVIARNLNNVIDNNFYPTPETRASNMATRPMGIGIQGLGDLFCALGLPFDDPEAVRIDAEVMETIYHGALEASVELAIEDSPYQHFIGSPFCRGVLQQDMWKGAKVSPRWDWDGLRARIMKHGTRNSLLTALMPTATTSQILGNTEMFEPISSNVFKRTTLAGEFMVVNKHLMQALMERGLWDTAMRDELLMADGSVQGIHRIPEEVRRVFRTIWELPQRSLIDHAAARAPFVDQSQSMNLYLARPDFTRLHSALMYAWKAGLKTGCYYLRSKPAKEAARSGVEPVPVPAQQQQQPQGPVCRMEAGCISCGS
jgi:ribonucleoside-diphosphate reductase alpha chain